MSMSLLIERVYIIINEVCIIIAEVYIIIYMVRIITNCPMSIINKKGLYPY